MEERPPQAVLFACSMNAVRSPMAEGLVKRRFGTKVFVASVGARTGERDPMMVEVMDELGVDMSRHRPKTFDQLEDTSYDLVITFSPEAHHRALELTRHNDMKVEYWPTWDPTQTEGTREQRLDAYREVRDALDRKLADRLAMLKGS